jgi:hypothetical protein
MLFEKHEHHMQQYRIILFALIYYYTSGIGYDCLIYYLVIFKVHKRDTQFGFMTMFYYSSYSNLQ